MGLLVSELELIRSLARDSFYDFVKEFWHTVIAEKPVWNWHIRYLCNELQIVAERVFAGEPKKYDLLVNVPPGTTKSTVASVMFPTWVLQRMPTARMICGSHTHELVLDLSRKSRDIVRSDLYQQCFPYVVLREDQDTKGYWATVQGGYRFCCTVGGKTPTGFHGHILIVDDPIDPQKAVSEVEIKSSQVWISDTLSQRKVDKEVTPTVMIMQRLHQADPSGYWLERAKSSEEFKVKHICLPGEETELVHPPELKRKYKGGLLDPIRLSKRVLKEQHETLGEYGYAGQYLQNPVPLGGGMFKVGRIIVEDAPPPEIEFSRIVRYWDKAGTHEGGAYTCGVKMGLHRSGLIWILHVIRGQWESYDREMVIVNAAKSDGRKNVKIGLEQEPGSGGKESAESTCRRLTGWGVWIDRVTGDKVLRADPFSVQVNAGNVRMVRADWNEKYLDELRFFPFSTYKDQVDASSGAFTRLARRKITVGAM